MDTTQQSRYGFYRWSRISPEEQHKVLIDARSLLCYLIANEASNVVATLERDAMRALSAVIQERERVNPDLIDAHHYYKP